MNVASLDLCRELYELSGWDGTQEMHWEESGSIETFDYDRVAICPAYDLGYLMRKLPAAELRTPFVEDDGDYFALQGRYGTSAACHADTPEDAVAMLAIDLLKNKILVKS